MQRHINSHGIQGDTFGRIVWLRSAPLRCSAPLCFAAPLLCAAPLLLGSKSKRAHEKRKRVRDESRLHNLRTTNDQHVTESDRDTPCAQKGGTLPPHLSKTSSPAHTGLEDIERSGGRVLAREEQHPRKTLLLTREHKTQRLTIPTSCLR